MKKSTYLKLNREIFNNKTVLDLACHTGESSKIIQQQAAKFVIGIEVRKELIDIANKNNTDNIEFHVGDITDPNVIVPLLNKSQTVVCLGVLYHLYNHFGFLQQILQPHIEYCLIETLFGPETLNPEMFWSFEETSSVFHGHSNDLSLIPVGTPNISWITTAARIFGFECDWIEYYGQKMIKPLQQITIEQYSQVAGPDWPPYEHIIKNHHIPKFVKDELKVMLYEYPVEHRRMILRLYNTNKIQSRPLKLKDIFSWPL